MDASLVSSGKRRAKSPDVTALGTTAPAAWRALLKSGGIVYMEPRDVASAMCVCTHTSPRPWTLVLCQALAPNYVANAVTMLMHRTRGVLDMQRIFSGLHASALRRAVFRECLLRLIPDRSWAPHRPNVERGTVASTLVRPSDGENVVAGSCALHEYIRQTENRTPDWTPGDIDVWVPNRLLPHFIEQQFRKACLTTMHGLTVMCKAPVGQSYGAVSSASPFVSDEGIPQMSYTAVFRNRALGEPNRGPGCVITSVTDFHVQDDGSPDTEPVKVSFIATMPDNGPGANHTAVTTASIINRFDLNICRVAMRVNADTGARTFHVDDTVKTAIAQRRGRVMYGDNPRLSTRIDKYRRRGFAFNDRLT